MSVTLSQARAVVAEFTGNKGKCKDSDDVRDFVMEVIDRLLNRGATGNIKKWQLHLCNGCFTAPVDMETPLKVKIDGYPDRVWSKWYEFHDVHESDLCDKNFKSGLTEQANDFYTVYDLPHGGARIAPVPLVHEAEDAYVIIQGEDRLGKDVFTFHNGVHIHGEKIPLSRSTPYFSKTHFTKITGIEKSKTCNYVRLYWQTIKGDSIQSRGLLSEIRPTELHPTYRRFEVPGARKDCCVKVEVLGRIKRLEMYHDNDVLPIKNISAMRLMAMTIQAERSKDIAAASYFNKRTNEDLSDENESRRNGEEPFDFIFETSPGNNENLQ